MRHLIAKMQGPRRHAAHEPQTVYRGLVVPAPVDLEGLAKSVGRNWTTDYEISQGYADPLEYKGIPTADPHGLRGEHSVGVHFEGEWDGDPDSVDHDWDKRIHPDEMETRFKPGTPIRIKNINYVYPQTGWDEENVLSEPRDFRAGRDA